MRYLFALLTVLMCSGTAVAQNGLDFDGVNDYVGSNFSGIGGNAERTVEAWIRTSVNAVGNQQVIVDMGTMANGTRFTFCVLQNNSLRCEVGGNGIVGTTPINDGNWHHVAATFDPAAPNNLVLYIDGNVETQGNFTVSVNTALTGSVEIGRRNDQINNFTGTIDEVRVWDVARTQAEIQASMNSEICNTNPNLRLYYRFNQGNAGGLNLGVSQATDDSGNGFTGTLSNFAYNGSTSNWVTGATLSSGLTSTTISEDACGTYTWPLNGQTYIASGFYSEVLIGSTGCDSTVILDLSIFNPNDLTTNQTSCDSFTWGVNGQTYTSSTTVTEVLTTAQGCPYNHTLNVTINNGFDSIADISACAPYIWPVNGQTLTIPGQYTETFTAANGCDSTYTIQLFLIPVLVSEIMDNGDGTLSTTSSSGIAYWYDCINDSIILGANGLDFTPTYNGSFAVIWEDWGFACPDTSDCIEVDYIGLDEPGPINSGINIEPNPTNGAFVINLDAQHGALLIEIVDAQGKIIQEQWVSSGVPTELLIKGESGVYFIRALSEFGYLTERIVKL